MRRAAQRRKVMILVDMAVRHKAFGEGLVIAQNGSYITVRFGAADKTFVYPDVFERFLTLADGSVSDEIKSEVEASKRAKQAIQNKKNEENLRAMTRGIVIPGKDTREGDDEDPRFKDPEE